MKNNDSLEKRSGNVDNSKSLSDGMVLSKQVDEGNIPAQLPCDQNGTSVSMQYSDVNHSESNTNCFYPIEMYQDRSSQRRRQYIAAQPTDARISEFCEQSSNTMLRSELRERRLKRNDASKDNVDVFDSPNFKRNQSETNGSPHPNYAATIPGAVNM